jgi:hypothetical protein
VDAQPAVAGTTWRDGIARRLRRLAGAVEPADPAPGPGARLAAAVEPAPGEAPAQLAERRLRAVVEELYPTVADRVMALATRGVETDADEWVAVARLLYDAHMHRVGGPGIEARQRALLATLGQALEAQARSSARLAGFAEPELDRPSAVAGDPPGTLVWEHYLCPPARLARSALHGEAVGDWLGALGELWSAANALYEHVTAETPAAPDADASDDEERAALLERVKVALVRVQELSLW